MDLKIPKPIRRFQSMKISTTKILLIGGLGADSQELDAVFCFDLEKEYTIEQLDTIDRAGIIDFPILLDQIGNLHLFLENNNGTSPHHHVVYSFLEYSWFVGSDALMELETDSRKFRRIIFSDCWKRTIIYDLTLFVF